MIEFLLTLAVAETVVVAVLSRVGPNWNYPFGVLYFGGIPFVGLLQDGLIEAMMGYCLGTFIVLEMLIMGMYIEKDI